jgi:hypothetical protein
MLNVLFTIPIPALHFKLSSASGANVAVGLFYLDCDSQRWESYFVNLTALLAPYTAVLSVIASYYIIAKCGHLTTCPQSLFLCESRQCVCQIEAPLLKLRMRPAALYGLYRGR